MIRIASSKAISLERVHRHPHVGGLNARLSEFGMRKLSEFEWGKFGDGIGRGGNWVYLVGFDPDLDGVVDNPLDRHHYLHRCSLGFSGSVTVQSNFEPISISINGD
ncbi:electron transfer flavoprotein beta [Actinidia rufa]|uniref:Electron transfer flavoprotein beta n=1 Tax=Actinidia rufa TaxID=165716 RepID=A0A7J0EA19_9ERIC|nr:electron transfer flavoprotein beta [Actinidia rufa]